LGWQSRGKKQSSLENGARDIAVDKIDRHAYGFANPRKRNDELNREGE
jgi:hypothetical protein